MLSITYTKNTSGAISSASELQKANSLRHSHVTDFDFYLHRQQNLIFKQSLCIFSTEMSSPQVEM